MEFENYSFHNNFYLPDMTEEGIFLGGGDMAGTFKDWTIPDYGSNDFTRAFYKYSLNAKGGGGNDDWGSNATRSSSLNDAANYVGHVNTSGKFYPKHYNVECWIKYK